MCKTRNNLVALPPKTAREKKMKTWCKTSKRRTAAVYMHTQLALANNLN